MKVKLFTLIIFLFTLNINIAFAASLNLNTGWNMFSLPVNKTITREEMFSGCSLIGNIWNYNPMRKMYNRSDTLYPGLGYWVKLTAPCTITFDGNAVRITDFSQLKAGWDQIGALDSSVSYESVKGSCIKRSGPWFYNSTTRRYVLSNNLDPGYGYWLKVESDCTLSEPKVCGNNKKEGTEECDGSDLDSQSCVSKGFNEGALGCIASGQPNECKFNTSGCIKYVCGNDILETGEECDKTKLGDQTCVSKGYRGGTLGCTESCTFNITGCTPPICGNDILEPGEECDKTKLGDQTCISKGFDAGTLSCIAVGQSNECKFNTSGCINYVCGNNKKEGSEQCDGTDLGGQTCVSKGFDEGTLGCTASCTFDTSGCYVCGNNVKEGTEECDGTDLRETCISKGFDAGTLSCIASGQPNECKFNTSGCVNYVCGNDILEPGEECDKTKLGGQTCVSKGFISGTLGCIAAGQPNECKFDTSSCCSCTLWVSRDCGGTCNSWEERFNRTCTPAGCAVEYYCSPTSSCCNSACGSWTNGPCLAAPEAGCDCSGSVGARWRTRTCPSGATICVKKECLYTNLCPSC